MFGRRRPEPEDDPFAFVSGGTYTEAWTDSQLQENLEPDPAAQAEKLVNEMRQQLQHSRGEPLQAPIRKQPMISHLTAYLAPALPCTASLGSGILAGAYGKSPRRVTQRTRHVSARSAKRAAMALAARLPPLSARQATPTRAGITAPQPLRADEGNSAPHARPCAWLAVSAAVGFRAGRRSRTSCRAADAVAVKKENEADEEFEPFFEEVAGDDPMVTELEARLRKMNNDKSLTLDMVLNPGTIVNTEREVILLKAKLKATPDEDEEERTRLEDKIEEKQMKIVNEMKLVMSNNLKLESIFAFGAMCYDAFPWIPDLTWAGINKAGSMLALKLFGVWGLWLFTVPALRARKPGGPYGMGYEEKRALDLSFLVLPFACLFGPVFFKDAAVTFWISLVTLAGLYAWSFSSPLSEDGKIQRGAGQDLNLPEPVMWAIKALDFGTGSERGARSEDTTWQAQLAAYEKAGDELAELKEQRKAEAEAKP
ncbi:unnamed protein product [Effrenium voratum]|uniref:Uncharacterized protein n=1 Tax=Effrenium voratum TaxID=2562239 RepID=A0AA36JN69_9DINO|nr:unnamed protein product [Effrenium voratum]